MVILDQVMPTLDGMATLAKLREIDSAVPVLFSTGNIDETLADRGRRLGVKGVLHKPYDLHQLAASIERSAAPKPSKTPRRRPGPSRVRRTRR